MEEVRKLTNALNRCNVSNIQSQIRLKQGYKPFLATQKDSVGAVTDFDTFPYPRFFRGEVLSSEPIVIEREAGWRIRTDWCYNPSVKNVSVEAPNPQLRFQLPDNTIVPPGATCNVGYR